MMAEYIEKFWRPATVADVERAAIGTVNARFRDVETDPWYSNDGSCELKGVKVEGVKGLLWLARGSGWRHCQVYSPPQWYLDKPDPGEGFRLLEKFPDEALQVGDEIRLDSGRWAISHSADNSGPQQADAWYRRKIEQPKPEPKFAVGQRVKIIGPKRAEKVRYNWEQGMDNQVGKTGVVTGSHDGSFGRLYQLSGIVEWNFQEEYLEPVVEPEPKHYTLQVGDTADTGNGFRLTVTEHGVEVT